MPEFLELLPPQKAIEKLLNFMKDFELDHEIIKTENGLNRIISKDINSNEDVPAFTRSTVDGFAVKSKDTFGASDAVPAFFEVIGEIRMGHEANFLLQNGQACLIHTGGMLPSGSDAVVMVENTQYSNPEEIEVYKSIASGENVILKGEDVRISSKVLEKGTLLRSSEIGALMALGITEINVFKLPQIGIISTGDEVVNPEELLKLGQVRDINSYTLSAIIQKFGGIPKRYPIVRDDKAKLSAVLKIAHQENDLVMVTAGSSASVRDFTADAINEIGDPGVLVHGINVKPGKPTILAFANEKPIIGLPGNPVSAYVIAHMLLTSIMPKIRGDNSRNRDFIRGLLTINIASIAGREDWIPVKILKGSKNGLPLVEPIFYKSNLIFTLINADGLARIDPDQTGLDENSEVEILLI